MVSEFYCDQCRGFNTVDLDNELNGLHTIICGKCKHKHFRVVTNGELSDVRFDEKAIKRYKLNIFTYTGKWKEKSWEKTPFLSELWAKTVSL